MKLLNTIHAALDKLLGQTLAEDDFLPASNDHISVENTYNSEIDSLVMLETTGVFQLDYRA